MFLQHKRSNLMGESKKEALRVQFDPAVKLEFHGAKFEQRWRFAGLPGVG